MTDSTEMDQDFKLDFSNRVIEHLGIKLYQNRPTNVVAEFVSNSWDADADKVTIDLKASTSKALPSIVITDNGRGMSRQELIHEFLVIGRNRRTSPSQKTTAGRLPMGRKGIGKLAGFGIAKTIDILSVPNAKRRSAEDAPVVKLYWLRFHLNQIIAETTLGGGGYSPEVIADGLDIADFESFLDAQGVPSVYGDFKEHLLSGEGGVCIHLRDLTLKKAINPDSLLKSLGNRFTVTMLRPDFTVLVNGKPIAPEHAFPPFQDFGYGSIDVPITEKAMFAGVEREIRYWVKFVSLSDSDWSIENAGVGVYAHGKIAQDRPFFFGVKGKEIFSRYLYCVVEADWLDEMPDDVVSTDRRSINWDTDVTSAFYEWGSAKLAGWVEGFRKWRKDQPKKEIVERIRSLSPSGSLTGTEEEALAELLSDVLPALGNDEEAKNSATSSITAAWTHQPTRQLTKTLWEQVFATDGMEANVFASLVEQLRNSLVPEAMGLAVTMAQRIAAITTMRKLIESDKTETHLQRLIEQFPWLLGPEWEKLTANETIRTLVQKKHKPDPDFGEWAIPSAPGSLKPDFVFLSDIGEQQEIVVFELKGPEGDKTLQPDEYRQLARYLDIIRSSYPDKHIKVHGILVGHDKGGFEENDKRIEVVTWASVLASARALHVSYLASLLSVSDPAANDTRLRQISDFGGKETMELLSRLGAVTCFPDIVKDGLSQ